MIRRRIYAIITVPVFAYLYAFTAIIVFLILISSYLKWKRGAVFLISIWARSVFLLMGKRLRINGKENLVKGKKYILLANHTSMFDIMAIMAIYPGVSWFGQEKLMKIPLFGKMLMMIDYIPMSMANVHNTRRMMNDLTEKAKDKTIAIFPEGTRTKDGKLNPFYRGFIYLLRSTETDILPVTLNGLYRLKPKNRFYLNFGAKLEVIIHEPIESKNLLPMNDKMIIDKLRSVIGSASIEENITQ